MKKMIQNNEIEFHSVEFMRKVRDELSELYNSDKNKYLKELNNALLDFKIKQKEVLNLNGI